MCDDKRLKSITAIVKAEKNFNFRIFRNITGEKTLFLILSVSFLFRLSQWTCQKTAA